MNRISVSLDNKTVDKINKIGKKLDTSSFSHTIRSIVKKYDLRLIEG